MVESNHHANLGESKETLSNGNNVLHLPNGIDLVLNSLSVFGTSTIEDTLDFGNLGLSPVMVGLVDELGCNSCVRTIQ